MAVPMTDAIKRLSLNDGEYAFVEDANRGVVLLEVGPMAVPLEAHRPLLVKERMVELGAGTCCVLREAHEREVRVGPAVFPLSPGDVEDIAPVDENAAEEAIDRAQAEAEAARSRLGAGHSRERQRPEVQVERRELLNALEVERARIVAEIEAEAFRRRVEATGGGEVFVRAAAAEAQAHVAAGIDEVVFLPSGRALDLFDAMEKLLAAPAGKPLPP